MTKKGEIYEKNLQIKKGDISDYFWKSAEEVLSEINFDMNKYKKICKNLTKNSNYDVFAWKNDLGVTAAPVSIIDSKRNKLLKKINILKLKKKRNYRQRKRK